MWSLDRMKISFFIVLLFIPGVLLAQKCVSIENGMDYDSDQVSTFLLGLQKTNDYVISFRTRLTGKNDEKSDYFILTNNNGKLSAYTYQNKANKLQQINLPAESLGLVWKTFIQNDLFKIRDEKDIANFCADKYQIYNSYTYEFVLLSKGKMKKLSYYNPEYYDTACYGMEERQKIINSVSVVDYLLNK